MGLWGKRIREAYAGEPAGPQFAVDADSIDPAVFGLASYSTTTSPAPRVNRKAAIQVPAVKRSRDLIAGTIGTLPLHLHGADRGRLNSELLDQPEEDTPRSVTMTRLVEDLLFESVAWWEITTFDAAGYPLHVHRCEPERVNTRDGKVYYLDPKTNRERQLTDAQVIRFTSANDALLVAGARAIRACLMLDATAARYADEPMPTGYFTPKAGEPDPEDDTKVTGILADWQTARQNRSTGYVPAWLDYHTTTISPKDLQLADARQHAVLEIARVAGIDPEELGVSTTSRTYANAFDRRKQFIDFTLGGYLTAIADRLSMPDVTPPGNYARFNLDAFLRSDALARYQAYAAGLAVHALDEADIAALEDKPTPKGPTTVTHTAPPAVVILHSGEVALTLDASAPDTFAVDREARTITGLAVPYGKVATSKGRRFQFAQGSLQWTDPTRVKLYIGHDPANAVGYAAQLDDRTDGLYPVFKVARGPEGDRALTLAEDKVLDGLSLGLGAGGTYDLLDGVHHAKAVPLVEISLTPCPAFDDARVAVAAGADPAAVTFTGEAGQALTHPAAQFASLGDAIREGFAALAHPQTGARPVIPAGGPVDVREELPYRFDGRGGEHGFIADFRAMQSGDNDARQRVETFFEHPDVAEVFAVTTAGVSALNPTANRPELYVGNLQYSTPLWDLVSNGTIDNATPFTVPKFSAATGLVDAHTQGTEPTPGTFSATAQTVTPGPLSGKIEINREVWDAEGNPQADAIIWTEMLNAWFEAREAKIAALLNAIAAANTLGGAELNLASAVDGALVAAMTNYLAGLQFVRGGNRFTAFAADGTLFPALVAAKDTAGRPLFPVTGPVNAHGAVGAAFDRVMIGNLPVLAAWGLSSGNTANSYNFVPSSVWAWASAPKKFVFEYQLKSVDMGIWGYMGTACIREADVKRIDYTTPDV